MSKTTIDMAREAGDDWDSTLSTDKEFLERLVALARADAIADEREQGQKWFEAVTAQHKQLILAEREKAKHNEEVLMNALWKACGDDAQVVEATIESQGELR
jgi:hypothetical protein